MNLPEKIAEEKDCQVIVCIDEFQKLAKLDDYDRLESQMRSVWQHQQKTSYCLYGSQRHMMTEIFDSPEKPFYRFGQMYNLKKIEKNMFSNFRALYGILQFRMPMMQLLKEGLFGV